MPPALPRLVWLGGVAVWRRIRDREVASSIPGCSAARCNSGQVVHTRVPLFTKQYKLVPASAGGKGSGVGYAGSHSAHLAVGGQPAPLQHRFHRAKLRVARYCHGMLSVCSSVTLRYRDHIRSNSAKIISRLITPISLSADPNMMDLLQREHPQILAGIGVG